MALTKSKLLAQSSLPFQWVGNTDRTGECLALVEMPRIIAEDKIKVVVIFILSYSRHFYMEIFGGGDGENRGA